MHHDDDYFARCVSTSKDYSAVMANIKDNLTNLYGNSLLQNDVVNAFCEIKLFFSSGRRRERFKDDADEDAEEEPADEPASGGFRLSLICRRRLKSSPKLWPVVKISRFHRSSIFLSRIWS